jgi:hypothetical protein
MLININISLVFCQSHLFESLLYLEGCSCTKDVLAKKLNWSLWHELLATYQVVFSLWGVDLYTSLKWWFDILFFEWWVLNFYGFELRVTSENTHLCVSYY